MRNLFSLMVAISLVVGCGDGDESDKSDDGFGCYEGTHAEGAICVADEDHVTDDGTPDDTGAAPDADGDGTDDTGTPGTGDTANTGDTGSTGDTASTGDTGTSPMPVSDCTIEVEGDGFFDCAMTCLAIDFYSAWIGDGVCDDGDRAVDFYCEDLGWDGGDCAEDAHADSDADADADSDADADADADADDGTELDDDGTDPDDGSADDATASDRPVAVCDVSPNPIRPLIDSADWIGRDSYDPDGLTLTYDWVLIEAPMGSSEIMPSGGADRLGFTTVLAGEYVGRLIVTNSAGVASDPCEARLEAIPGENLWVEMFWTYPGDDMDLHLLAPGGSLETDTDCYYGNCTAASWTVGLDWGIPGDTSDDPTLDLDDISLTGPEIINIESPEDATYTVVVHDYPGSVYDAVNPVTVNIYLDGSLEWTDTRDISGEDSYTEFALIDTSTGSVTGL
jgi:hypothetical protein